MKTFFDKIFKFFGVYIPPTQAPVSNTQTSTHIHTRTHIPDNLTYTRTLTIPNTHTDTHEGFEADIGMPKTTHRDSRVGVHDEDVINEFATHTPPIILDLRVYAMLKPEWANGMSAAKMAIKYSGDEYKGVGKRKCDDYVKAFYEVYRRQGG